jgi:erythromycin esterase
VELRSSAADFPEISSELPNVSYRLRLETAPPEQSAAEHAKIRATTSWLAANVRPLRRVEAGSGFEDLLPLHSILRGVRIVGLGESTHGTREFFQVKHRILEFLVSQMGFTHFVMEIDQGAAKAINEFVLHGRGDRAEAVAAAGMWQWDTQEVAAMLDWMRHHNRGAPKGRHVSFVGFDFQMNDRGVEEVLAYLRRVAPDRVSSSESALAPIIKRPDPARTGYVEYYAYSPEQKAATLASVQQLLAFMERNRARFVRSTSAAEYEEVRQSAKRLWQFADAHSRPGYEQDQAESQVATRDRYMAENIHHLLRGAGQKAKIVLWSHNEHIRRDAYNMGYYLGQRYGTDYYAFGVAFNRGAFRALEITGKSPAPLKTFTLPPAFQNSVGWYMQRTGAGNAFVDFRHKSAAEAAAELFAKPLLMRSIGNGYAPGNPSGYYRAPAVLGKSYDGIILIEHTTPAVGRVADSG